MKGVIAVAALIAVLIGWGAAGWMELRRADADLVTALDRAKAAEDSAERTAAGWRTCELELDRREALRR